MTQRRYNSTRSGVLSLAAWAAKTGILHPEMPVESGSYDKPMATIGTMPTQPWSGSTVSAGVDNKPEPGKRATMVREILLTKDGSLYMLMPEEHDPRRDGGVSLPLWRSTTWAISWKSTAPKPRSTITMQYTFKV